MADEKQNLDGKAKIKPVPFDAHEQATRGEHVETKADSPDKDAKSVAQYPKAVEHDDYTGEPVVVNSAKEEADYKAKKAAEAKKIEAVK